MRQSVTMKCRMQNAERRIEKRDGSAPFSILNSAFCVLRSHLKRLFLFFMLTTSFFLLPSLIANELSVDRRTLRLNESVTIIVSLEDAFADVDRVHLPLQNLQIESGPNVSSEFSWINGVIVRRKVFRYVARALRTGPALVGPLVVRGQGGQQQTLGALALQVTPDATAGTSDPAVILRELLATGRDPFYVVAEADRATAYVGEEVVVTWVLYNAATIQEWRIARVPRLADFWAEELDVRGQLPSRVTIGATTVQRLPIRRVAVFPLRSGKLTVDALDVVGEVMRRIDSAPFGIGEWSVVDVRFSSAPLTIEVKPVPADGVATVGDVTMRCSPPVQAAGGPVTFDVRLSGRANLRGIAPPAWQGQVDGEVQVEQGAVQVDRRANAAIMSRRWKYVIFPAHAGRFDIPPLVSRTFSPAAGPQRLQCEGVSLTVQAASSKAASSRGDRRLATATRSPRRFLPWLGVAVGVAFLAAIAARRMRRAFNLRRMSESMASQTSLDAVRSDADAFLEGRGLDPRAVLSEASERGDSYRALRSLLELLERQRRTPADARKEIRARARDLVQSLGLDS